MVDRVQKNPNALRWYQLRLRTVLLIFTLVAILLAAFGFYVRPYLRQKEAIRAITYAGGVVETRGGPKWLRSILGEDNCRVITLVNVADIDPTDELLSRIAGLPDLEILVLGGNTISNDTLRYVPDCETLKGLVLDSTLVSPDAVESLREERPRLYVRACDRALAYEFDHRNHWICVTRLNPTAEHLLAGRISEDFLEDLVGLPRVWTDSLSMEDVELMARMPKLETLGLLVFPPFDYSTGEYLPPAPNMNKAIHKALKQPTLKRLEIRFRDLEWMGGLTPMPQFEALVVRTETQEGFFLTDEDVAALLRLFPNLKELSLFGAAVTSPEKWPPGPLKELNLDQSEINDRSLKGIASQFPNLRSLKINLTDVTDAGIPDLLPLKNLEILWLLGTRVTEASYETLCQFPKLRQISIGAWDLHANYGAKQQTWDTEHRRFSEADQPFQNYELQDFDWESLRPSPDRIANLRKRLFQGDVERFEFLTRTYFAITPMESLHLDALQIPPEITAIDCTDTYLDDAGLERICEFPQLEVVKLHNTWVTDEGIRHLLKLKNLRAIDLAETRTTAECISVLTQIPTLETIRLPVTVDGSCVDELLKLPNLRYVSSVRRPHSVRRMWGAKKLTLEDVAQFRRLAEVLFQRADQDHDGVVTGSDFAGVVTFTSLKISGDVNPPEWTSPHDLLRKAMLYECLATPEARLELLRSEADQRIGEQGGGR